MKDILLAFLLLAAVSAHAQDVRVAREAEKLYIIENGIVRDTIIPLRPNRIQQRAVGTVLYRVVGDVLYYVDGFFTPDRLKLVLFKIALNDRNAPKKTYLIRSFYLNDSHPLEMKLKRNRLVLFYERGKEREKLVRKYGELEEEGN